MMKGINWGEIELSQKDREAILAQFAVKNGYEFISLAGKSNAQVFHVQKSKKEFIAKLIKIQREDATKTEQSKQQDKRFEEGLREIETMRKAKEKGFNNAVKIYEYYEVTVTPQRKYLIIIMETLDKILFDQLKKFQTLDKEFRKKTSLKLAEAVYQMYRKTGIIHRDIKPENIAIETDFKNKIQIKLLDFGLARICEDNRKTKTIIGRGTLDYIAPQIRSDLRDDDQDEELKYDYTVDYWALGIVMIEIMFGDKISQLKKRICRNIQEIGKKIDDEELRKLILILISRTPEDRKQADKIIKEIIDKGTSATLEELTKQFQKLELEFTNANKKTQQKQQPKSKIQKYYKTTTKLLQIPQAITIQKVTQIPQTVQKIIEYFCYMQTPQILEQVQDLIISIDEQKKEPRVVVYKVEEIQIVENKVEEEEEHYTAEEQIVVFDQIQKVPKLVDLVLEQPILVVNPEKAKNMVYPVSIVNQEFVAVPKTITKYIDVPKIKECAQFVETIIRDVKLIVKVVENPIFISINTGKVIPVPDYIKLQKKTLKRIVEIENKIAKPKIINIEMEKIVQAVRTVEELLPSYVVKPVEIYIP